jgi:hypothetical protein
MNQKELDNVIKLEPLERYKYFIKKVADWEVFYTLMDEKNEFAISEIDEHKLFPVWTDAKFAATCKIGGWENYTIHELNLDDLDERVVMFISLNNCLVNVFPIFDRTGFVVTLQEFIRDLNEELEKIE